MSAASDRQSMSRSGFFAWLTLLLVLGAALQIWLMIRSGIGGDQYQFLDMGLDFVETGRLKPVAKGMSGDGAILGGFMQLLFGVPLLLWHDYRAPVVLMGLFHLAAGLLGALTIREAAGERPALLFTALWWLSPWRLYHSGFLWEPNFLFLPAVVHLWSCWKLRSHPPIVASALLGATLVLTFQLHGSFLYLIVLTGVLLVRRVIRLRWGWGIFGGAVGSLTLLPTAAALLEGTLRSPAPTKSFVGYGLVTVVPVLRGLGYWFRLASLDVGRRLQAVRFLDPPWSGIDPAPALLKGLSLFFIGAALLSVLLAIAASWWYFRRDFSGEGEGRVWLGRYSSSALLAVLIVSALSPVTIQGWHVMICLPAAALPLTFWIGSRWRGAGRWLRVAIVLFLFLRLPEIAVIGLGHRTYHLDSDVATRLTVRQQALLPEEYRPKAAE